MLKNLLKDSVIYGVGTIIPKSLTFLFIPILIGYFTPAEYGQLELLISFCALLQVLMGLGLDSGQSFYFFKYKFQRENVVKTVLYARMINGSLLVITCTLFSSMLAELLELEVHKELTLTYVFAYCLFTQLFTQLNEVLRLLFRPKQYVILVNIQVILNQAFSITLAVYMEMGIFGYFKGLLISIVITYILAIYVCKDTLKVGCFDNRILVKLLKFSLPLLPANISMYLVTSLDRWMINLYLEPEYLGKFALGAKIALAFKLAIEVFRKAWWPYGLKYINMPQGKDVFRLISFFYVFIASLMLVCISLIVPMLFDYIGNRNYVGSEQIAVVLCIEAVIYGYFLIGGIGIWKSEKTYINTILMLLGVIVNILFNMILIPKFGIIGAAFATIISSLVWCLMSIAISNLYWDFGANNFVLLVLFTSAVLIAFQSINLLDLNSYVYLILVMFFIFSSLICLLRIYSIKRKAMVND